MNETTLGKMKQMKFYGMHNTFKTAIETGKSDSYSIDQFVAPMIEAGKTTPVGSGRLRTPDP